MQSGELERAHHNIERVSECLEMLMYTVSHDLRAPLRAVDAYSRLVAEEQAGLLTHPARRYLERIQQEVKLANDMIFHVLTVARSGLVEEQLRPLNLSAIASEVASQLHATDPSRSVEVVIEKDVEAKADAILTRQLLQNLFDNAWKFTQRCADARIEFGCEHVAGVRTFFVRDNGAGFDSKAARKLFRPFERLHPVTEFDGTGIGLASAKRIVQLHGGTIWADAKAGKGACFYFTLPGTESTRDN
jgi:light-regulated signal transduction histidine kinase (bacteriophytochrome)